VQTCRAGTDGRLPGIFEPHWGSKCPTSFSTWTLYISVVTQHMELSKRWLNILSFFVVVYSFVYSSSTLHYVIY